MTHDNLLEELENVATNQPLFPGDTVSHAGAYALARLGLIQRNADDYWVLTPNGLSVYQSLPVNGIEALPD